jgi:hypothetical protein
MAKERNPKSGHKRPKVGLNDPAFVGYEIGSPMIIGLRDYQIIGYYSGSHYDDDRNLFDKKLFLRFSSSHDGNKTGIEHCISLDVISFTQLLFVSENFDNLNRQVTYGLFHKYLPQHTPIEITDDNGISNIGFTLRDQGLDTLSGDLKLKLSDCRSLTHIDQRLALAFGYIPPDLAHSFSKDLQYDTWFRPAFLRKEE